MCGETFSKGGGRSSRVFYKTIEAYLRVEIRL